MVARRIEPGLAALACRTANGPMGRTTLRCRAGVSPFAMLVTEAAMFRIRCPSSATQPPAGATRGARRACGPPRHSRSSGGRSMASPGSAGMPGGRRRGLNGAFRFADRCVHGQRLAAAAEVPPCEQRDREDRDRYRQPLRKPRRPGRRWFSRTVEPEIVEVRHTEVYRRNAGRENLSCPAAPSTARLSSRAAPAPPSQGMRARRRSRPRP